MRIKIWASAHGESPTSGPYKLLDIVEKESAYAIEEMTHYGEVILISRNLLPSHMSSALHLFHAGVAGIVSRRTPVASLI